MSDIAARLARLERGILAAVKDAAEEIPKELTIYVGEFMADPSYKTGLKTAKSGNLYYAQKNSSSRLRTLYGNIQRAITPGDRGNITKTQISSKGISVEFGYDTNTTVKSGTRSQSLAYAVINEKTRPFLQPGFAKFMNDKNGLSAILRELETAIIDEFNQEFG